MYPLIHTSLRPLNGGRTARPNGKDSPAQGEGQPGPGGRTARPRGRGDVTRRRMTGSVDDTHRALSSGKLGTACSFKHPFSVSSLSLRANCHSACVWLAASIRRVIWAFAKSLGARQGTGKGKLEPRDGFSLRPVKGVKLGNLEVKTTRTPGLNIIYPGSVSDIRIYA